LSDSLQLLENKCHEYENKILNQNKELELVKSGNNDLINKIEKLSNLIEELNLTIQKKESEISELQAQVELRKSSEFKSEESDKNTQEIKENIEKSKLELKIEKENYKNLKISLDEKESEFNHIMNEVIQSNKDKNQYQEANIHLQEEIFKITNELNLTKIQFEEEKNKKKLSDSNNENQNMDYENIKLDLKCLSNENEELRIQLDQALKEIENLQKANEKFEQISLTKYNIQTSQNNVNEKSENLKEKSEYDLPKNKVKNLANSELENIEEDITDDQKKSNEDKPNSNELFSIINSFFDIIINFISQIEKNEMNVWNKTTIQKINENIGFISKDNKIQNYVGKFLIEIWTGHSKKIKGALDLILEEISNQSIIMKNNSGLISRIENELGDYKHKLEISNNTSKKFEAELQNAIKNNSNYITQINIFNKSLKEKEERIKAKDLEITKLNSMISNYKLDHPKSFDQNNS